MFYHETHEDTIDMLSRPSIFSLAMVLSVTATIMAGCTSASDERHLAAAEVEREKAKLLEDYRECLDDNEGEDADRVCKGYKDAIEAVQ